jgi:hypothetical protein
MNTDKSEILKALFDDVEGREDDVRGQVDKTVEQIN